MFSNQNESTHTKPGGRETLELWVDTPSLVIRYKPDLVTKCMLVNNPTSKHNSTQQKFTNLSESSKARKGSKTRKWKSKAYIYNANITQTTNTLTNPHA